MGAVSKKRSKMGGLLPRLRFPEFSDSGAWEEKKVNQIADIYKGKGISKSDIVADGRQPCIRYGELYTSYGEIINTIISKTNITKTDLFLGKKNDVIIPASGETKIDIATAACVTLDDVALGGDLNILRSRQNGIFLSYFFNGNLRKQIAKVAQGDTVVHLYPKQLGMLYIAIPASKEQQKIADCLSSIDDLIASETRKLDTLKAHKKSLMQQLFPAEGETIPRLRFPEFQSAGEWSQKKLGEICDVLQGFGFPEAMQGNPSGDFPFCKVSDISRAVNDAGGRLGKAVNYVDASDLRKLRAKILPPGSTVFAKIGEALRLNRRAITTVDCLIDNNAVGLRVKEGLATTYFVYLLSQLIDLNEHCGGAVPSVNKSTLEEISVSVPNPLEQQRIADCLSSVDDLITSETRMLDTLKAHKKGLMQQLFPVPDEAHG